MSEDVTQAVSLHWFVEDFAGRKQLDVILRWLLASAPAVCVTDAHEQTVVWAERAELPLTHEWINVRFASGLVLRVAEPIDVPRSVFNARVDEATAFVRVIFDTPSHSGRSGPASSGGSGPANATAFAHAPSRRKS
ncbi:MAG: hypothetical protein JNK05_01520 [Myxococcales bacterium]|nr:hypothetical protein [Myxococcales bacterium]